MKLRLRCEHCGHFFWRYPSQAGPCCSYRCSSSRIFISSADRFWRKVTKTETCWFWNGTKNRPGGYGIFSVRRQPVYAHRFSYTLAYGSIPAGMFICHHCDTPACVRPDHLFLGDAKTNWADLISKGFTPANNWPHRLGEQHHRAKLKNTDVLAIRMARESGETLAVIAKRHDVSFQLIWQIVQRKIWTHL